MTDSNDAQKEHYDLIMKVADRLNEVREDVSTIKVTLERNTASLEHHVRRTDIAEANLALLRAEVKPLQDWHTTIANLLKLVAASATVLAILAAAAKLFSSRGG